MMKSIIFAFSTLFVLSHGLRVSLKVSPEDEGLTDIPEGQDGIMTYTPQPDRGIFDAEWLQNDIGNWLSENFGPKFEEAQGKTIVMRAHHRSGINLAKSVGECLAGHADRDMIARVVLFPEHVQYGEFTEETLAAGERPTLHFVRKLNEWVASWYQYSKTLNGEDLKYQEWMTKPGSMHQVHGADEMLTGFLGGMGVRIYGGESIKDFLSRVPAPVGLAVAYREMTTDVLPQAVAFAKACQDNLMCQQVCVEPLQDTYKRSGGQKKYGDIFKEIFMNMEGVNLNITANEGLKLCLDKMRPGANPEGIKYYEGYVKVNDRDKEEYLNIIKQMDWQLGRSLKQAEKYFNCQYASPTPKPEPQKEMIQNANPTLQ